MKVGNPVGKGGGQSLLSLELKTMPREVEQCGMKLEVVS